MLSPQKRPAATLAIEDIRPVEKRGTRKHSNNDKDSLTKEKQTNIELYDQLPDEVKESMPDLKSNKWCYTVYRENFSKGIQVYLKGRGAFYVTGVEKVPEVDGKRITDAQINHDRKGVRLAWNGDPDHTWCIAKVLAGWSDLASLDFEIR